MAMFVDECPTSVWTEIRSTEWHNILYDRYVTKKMYTARVNPSTSRYTIRWYLWYSPAGHKHVKAPGGNLNQGRRSLTCQSNKPCLATESNWLMQCFGLPQAAGQFKNMAPKSRDTSAKQSEFHLPLRKPHQSKLCWQRGLIWNIPQ